MNKLSFPKGSLKFKRITLNKPDQEKTPEWKKFLYQLTTRKKYVDVMEKEYPGPTIEGQLDRLPPEITKSFTQTTAFLKQDRAVLKAIPSFTIGNEYEITFKHPKWCKVIGDITLKANRKSIRDSLEQIRKEFKARKDKHRTFRMKQIVHHVKSYQTDIAYNVSGGIIYMPQVKEGIYAKFLKDEEKKIVFSPKIPKDNDNYVGIELEFLCDWDRTKFGLELFDAGVGKNVTLTEDHSLRCCPNDERRPENCEEHRGKLFDYELCVLAKESNYKEIMKKVCDVLAKANAVVNRSCGMHVHVDMRNRDAEKAYQNLISSQGILFKMNPKSRSEKYAKKVTSRDFDAVKNTPKNGYEYRYLGINPIAMKTHNTIEIRIHSGTIDYAKITNWITILIKVANHKERTMKAFASVKTFCKEFEVSERVMKYIEERVEKFQSKKDKMGIETDPQPERGVA